MHSSLVASAVRAVPLHALTEGNLKKWLASRPKRESAWLVSAGFAAKEGEVALIPAPGGEVAGAVLGLGKGGDPLALAAFAEGLPEGAAAESILAFAAWVWIASTYFTFTA